MSPTVRRVVTAQVDTRGIIAQDGAIVQSDTGGPLTIFDIWRTADPDGVDARGAAWDIMPPANGSVFRIIDFPPAAPGETAYMHRTETIDFGVILSGELAIVMDEGETVLRSGDCFVQRGAHHGWLNRSDAACRVMVILIDGLA